MSTPDRLSNDPLIRGMLLERQHITERLRRILDSPTQDIDLLREMLLTELRILSR